MSLWSMNDGSALTGTVTFNKDSTAVSGSGTAFLTEVNEGDEIYVPGGSNDHATATKLKVKNITSDTALVLIGNADLNESATAHVRKPPMDGMDAIPDTTSVFGVSAAEQIAGSDNVNSIALTSTTGARYVQAPTVTVAAPTTRTVATSAVDLTDDTVGTITIAGHGMATGTKLTYTSNGNNMEQANTDIADGDTVYVIRYTADKIKLASSLSNANAGTAYNLDDAGNNAQTFVGDTATATAAVSGGVVTAVTVSGVGSDYQSDPAVTIEVPKMTIPTSAVNAGTDVITFAGHGLTDTDQITYNQVGGGTLMSNVTDGQTVFVRDKTDNTFKIAATSGGTAIDIGTGHNAQTFTIVTDATQATATANRGAGGFGANSETGFHVGWVKRTVGTGGRAGRVQYETLVAASSISGDFEDIAFVEDA